MVRNFDQTPGQHYDVQQQIGNSHGGSKFDRLIKSFQKYEREQEQQTESNDHRGIAEERVEVWILDGMLRRVSRRECHSDDKICSRKSKQSQNQNAAPPATQQVFEHRNGALPDIRTSGNLRVNGKRTAKSNKDQDGGGNGRNRSSGEKRDTWLIAERGEIIDAGEPQNQVPRMSFCRTEMS